jgi:hypothetical protein
MDTDRFAFVGNSVERRFSRRQTIGYGGAGLAAALTSFRFSRASAGQVDATPAVAPPPPTWEKIDELLAGVAPSVALIAAELVDGAIQPVHAVNEDTMLPIGSSFKLWILGALAMQIGAGKLDWEQPVEIEDRYRSVPGGDLRYVRAGTAFSLRYLAERMIQKSDNTATDHVLFLVGRENVEAAMKEMGHSDPARNIPLFSTREMAMMKFAYPTKKVDAYFEASVEERRRILTEEIDTIPYEALADIDQTKPLEIDRIEWFATSEDLVRTMAWHLTAAQKPELRPVLEILALETPIPFDGEVWPYVGYKGGSEMGVLSGTWLLERSDGRHFVYSVGYRNPDEELDMEAAVGVMVSGRDRLALVSP